MSETSIFVLILLVFIWFVTPNNKLNPVQTVYLMGCSDFNVGVFDCKSKITVSKELYRPLLERQVVVAKTAIWTETLHPCSVMDKENWQCQLESGRIVRMSEGDLYDSSHNSGVSGSGKDFVIYYSQIGKLGYYLRRLNVF